MDFTVVKEVYVKTGIIWANVAADVDVFGHDQPVDRMNEYLLTILRRHVRVKILRLRSRDRPWFCRLCRVLYDEKQAAYHQWRISRLREDYDSYDVARVRAQRFFEGAMRRYEEGVRQKLADADSPHRWWRTLRESVFGVEQSVPPLVNPATGLLVSEPDQKAELLMRTFEAKQSSHILELPPTCHPQPVLRGVDFLSREIRELLSGFDSYGGNPRGTDSLGFFPYYIWR